MAMTYDEKLDAIMASLDKLTKEVEALKGNVAQPSVVVPPVIKTGGLYDFVRPVPDTPPAEMVDVEMTSPDAAEAKARAMYCVTWRGNIARTSDKQEVWDEIEKLKAAAPGDPVFRPYLDLDPEFCGFGLLTNLFQIAKYDSISFGGNVRQRQVFAGYTIQSFLDAQFAVLQGGGTPSGN